MNISTANIASKLEIHYIFADESHTMDAIVRNNCERELLAIVNEVASLLEVDIRIETEAYLEGGLKELWSFVSKNKFLIGIVTGILINVLSTHLTKDRELGALQKEELKLNIEKLKRELEQIDKKPKDYNIEDSVTVINKQIKIIKHRSNFYHNLIEYHKVDKVTTNLLTEGNQAAGEKRTTERKDFYKFILTTDELPPIIDEEATIEIVSPVLKKGKYKWKGIYNGEVIPFFMKDKEFKEQVIQEGVPFKNGTCIDCLLEISRKINDLGETINFGHAVLTVLRKHDEEISEETPQGRKYGMKKEKDKRQTRLFGENGNGDD